MPNFQATILVVSCRQRDHEIKRKNSKLVFTLLNYVSRPPRPKPHSKFYKFDVATDFISNIDLILLIETSCHFNFTIHNVNILKKNALSFFDVSSCLTRTSIIRV